MTAVVVYISFQVIVLVWESYNAYSSRLHDVGFDYTALYGKSVFITFFNILLALEVLETVKVFNRDHDVKIMIILIVCMIAVSRKILALDIHISGAEGEFAVAALVVSLAISYYLIMKTMAGKNSKNHNQGGSDDSLVS